MKDEFTHIGEIEFMGAIYYKCGFTSFWMTTFNNHKSRQSHKSEHDAKIFIIQNSLG